MTVVIILKADLPASARGNARTRRRQARAAAFEQRQADARLARKAAECPDRVLRAANCTSAKASMREKHYTPSDDNRCLYETYIYQKL